ncbi:MAG TPA: 2Fe-2S iron-sulfur cluster-binding protein [Cyclobacteriaceae bacterium]|nr:2Fe-2S iron-sulfur cluster-binding protein [Cyclobacteriaceae bacterium]
MSDPIKITIDGIQCIAQRGQYILEAAKANNIYIPSLCNYPGLKPRGGCRICNVRVNGKMMTACTTPVGPDMNVENNKDDINDLRKSIIELLFVEGNHYCPFCEKSGNCELQALAYRFKIMAPRFPYQFPVREVDASNPKLIKEQNRCIACKRCIRGIKDKSGRSLFAMKRRGHKQEVSLDKKLAAGISDELAQKAMDICPVGSIIRKEVGYAIPIGRRKYDKNPIGYETEVNKTTIV